MMKYNELIAGRNYHVQIHGNSRFNSNRIDIGMNASTWSDIHNALVYYLKETKQLRHDLPVHQRPILQHVAHLIEEVLHTEGTFDDYANDDLNDLVP